MFLQALRLLGKGSKYIACYFHLYFLMQNISRLYVSHTCVTYILSTVCICIQTFYFYSLIKLGTWHLGIVPIEGNFSFLSNSIEHQNAHNIFITTKNLYQAVSKIFRIFHMYFRWHQCVHEMGVICQYTSKSVYIEQEFHLSKEERCQCIEYIR